MKAKRLKNVVAIELGNRRLTAVELRGVADNQLELRNSARGTLVLDPWTASPELAGREIRNLLDQAGIRTKQCILCLPLNTILLHSIIVPPIDEADVDAFLALESERAFPFAPQDLVVSTSCYVLADGTRSATLAAVTTAQLAVLEKVLRLAGLQPVSISTATASVTAGNSAISSAIVLTDAGVEFVVSVNGSIAAMRLLDGAPEQAGKWDELDYEWIARELRITLGRLPRQTRDALERIDVFGTPEAQRAAILALGPELEMLALPLQPCGIDKTEKIATTPEQQVPASLLAVASLYLRTGQTTFNFLPPRVSRLSKISHTFLSRGLTWRLGSAATGVACLVIAAYAWQFWRLSNLERQWASMKNEAGALKDLQQKLHEYGPWFDDNIHSLEIARTLTSSFPETGSVWTRSLEIKDLDTVLCTGYASSNSDALHVLDALAKAKGVTDLKIGPLSGEKPVQFSASYKWEGRESHGSE